MQQDPPELKEESETVVDTAPPDLKEGSGTDVDTAPLDLKEESEPVVKTTKEASAAENGAAKMQKGSAAVSIQFLFRAVWAKPLLIFVVAL